MWTNIITYIFHLTQLNLIERTSKSMFLIISYLFQMRNRKNIQQTIWPIWFFKHGILLNLISTEFFLQYLFMHEEIRIILWFYERTLNSSTWISSLKRDKDNIFLSLFKILCYGNDSKMQFFKRQNFRNLFLTK